MYIKLSLYYVFFYNQFVSYEYIWYISFNFSFFNCILICFIYITINVVNIFGVHTLIYLKNKFHRIWIYSSLRQHDDQNIVIMFFTIFKHMKINNEMYKSDDSQRVRIRRIDIQKCI